MEEQELSKLICDTLESISEYSKYIGRSNASGDVKCTGSNNPSKDYSYAQYKGPDGSFKIGVDKKLRKVTVMSKFGSDKFEVDCDKNTTFVRGVRPVYHAHWSVFNGVFTHIGR